MGVVGISVETIGHTYPNGVPAPVFDAAPVVKEALSSGGSAVQSTVQVPAAEAGGRSLVWRIATDTAIWVAFGANPTAASGTDRFVPANGILECAAVSGHRVSVIDA